MLGLADGACLLPSKSGFGQGVSAQPSYMAKTKKLEDFRSPGVVSSVENRPIWPKLKSWRIFGHLVWSGSKLASVPRLLVPLRIACKGSESLWWHLHALPLFDLLNALLNAREIQVEVV
ncbi:hypothetical protein J433_00265 [Corynebacterium glutamicum MT]|nr:hypothetical protein C624_04525 [Corynebacterium glutamicum SCgG1]AGN21515.1 hypothetical protein C629_04525 [Corynebacterium glutamicum SCgG2]EOA66131.1 hypothetical protein J433_00265 [Corynebacterium glutamicum MT]EPP41401.1 hypothetical protein A583_04031 [Corynebacterium glutamicum Z188]